MTLDDLVLYCARGRRVGHGTGGYLSVTGQPYVTIGRRRPWPSGRKPEPAMYLERAVDIAKRSFDEYAIANNGDLYWRTKPQIDNTPEGVVIWMRLLISSKKRLRPAPDISSVHLETMAKLLRL